MNYLRRRIETRINWKRRTVKWQIKFCYTCTDLYTPQSFREADDSVEFTLSTEQPALIFDFARFELVNEIIVSDGVIIPDNKQIPLIDSHDRGTVKNILGSVRDFKI